MKVQAKQLLIALLVVAAMALAAVLGFRWLDRPREFSSLLPSPPLFRRSLTALPIWNMDRRTAPLSPYPRSRPSSFWTCCLNPTTAG